MGAKVGRCVYWPGTGIICTDPELLDVGNNVVFGLQPYLITTDRSGSEKIVIEDGGKFQFHSDCRCSDRISSYRSSYGSRSSGPFAWNTCRIRGCHGDRIAWEAQRRLPSWLNLDWQQLVLTLFKFLGMSSYSDISITENGEAVCLSKGYKEGLESDADTSTPFGRAFYAGQANYFVFPYTMVLAINVFMRMLSALYWSMSTVAVSQILQHIIRLHWDRLGILLYGVVASCFIIIHSLQSILAIFFVIVTSWLVIGPRQPGKYDWDQSSYCQRWNLHITFLQIMKGTGDAGVLASLAGTAYIVWYLRALGAKIGKNCAIWAGGQMGSMTEPDLVEVRIATKLFFNVFVC